MYLVFFSSGFFKKILFQVLFFCWFIDISYFRKSVKVRFPYVGNAFIKRREWSMPWRSVQFTSHFLFSRGTFTGDGMELWLAIGSFVDHWLLTTGSEGGDWSAVPVRWSSQYRHFEGGLSLIFTVLFIPMEHLSNMWHISATCGISQQHVAYLSNMWNILAICGAFYVFCRWSRMKIACSSWWSICAGANCLTGFSRSTCWRKWTRGISWKCWLKPWRIYTRTG